MNTMEFGRTSEVILLTLFWFNYHTVVTMDGVDIKRAHASHFNACHYHDCVHGVMHHNTHSAAFQC